MQRPHQQRHDLWAYCQQRQPAHPNLVGKSYLVGVPSQVRVGQLWSFAVVSRWINGSQRHSLADLYTAHARGPALLTEEGSPVGGGEYQFSLTLPLAGPYVMTITLDHADCHQSYTCSHSRAADFERPYFEQHNLTVFAVRTADQRLGLPGDSLPAVLTGTWISRLALEAIVSSHAKSCGSRSFNLSSMGTACRHAAAAQAQLHSSHLAHDPFYWWPPTSSAVTWKACTGQWMLFVGDSLDRQLFGSVAQAVNQSGHQVRCAGQRQSERIALLGSGTPHDKLKFMDWSGVPAYADRWWCLAPSLGLVLSYQSAGTRAGIGHDIDHLASVAAVHRDMILKGIETPLALVNASYPALLHGADATPTSIVVNFGLHAVSQLPYDAQGNWTGGAYTDNVKALLARLRDVFPKARLVWRRTAATQFPTAHLSSKFACRSKPRVDTANLLADRVVREATNTVLDMAELTRTQRWGAPDNRHYGDTEVNHVASSLLKNLVCRSKRSEVDRSARSETSGQRGASSRGPRL